MNLKDGLLTQGRYKGQAVTACPTAYLQWMMRQPRGIARAVQDAAALEYARRLSGQKDMTLEEAHPFLKEALFAEVARVKALLPPHLPSLSSRLWEQLADKLDTAADRMEKENSNHE